MCRASINLIRAPELSHIGYTDIILASMNPICIDDLSDIEMVVDDERFLKFLGKLFCFEGFFQYLLFGGILAAKLDNISAELESFSKYF
jgi:hypothetical protein